MLDAKKLGFIAGFLEGEGSFTLSPESRWLNGKLRPHRFQRFKVSITQKDPEILQRLKGAVGGNIRQIKGTGYSKFETTGRQYHILEITGPRARGLAMTVFQFMSTRRRDQIKKGLAGDGEKLCV